MYAHCLYYDHVIKCFVSKCVIQMVMYSIIAVHRHLDDDTFIQNYTELLPQFYDGESSLFL